MLWLLFRLTILSLLTEQSLVPVTVALTMLKTFWMISEKLFLFAPILLWRPVMTIQSIMIIMVSSYLGIYLSWENGEPWKLSQILCDIPRKGCLKLTVWRAVKARTLSQYCLYENHQTAKHGSHWKCAANLHRKITSCWLRVFSGVCIVQRNWWKQSF